jgi:hypothetical protein
VRAQFSVEAVARQLDLALCEAVAAAPKAAR